MVKSRVSGDSTGNGERTVAQKDKETNEAANLLIQVQNWLMSLTISLCSKSVTFSYFTLALPAYLSSGQQERAYVQFSREEVAKLVETEAVEGTIQREAGINFQPCIFIN